MIKMIHLGGIITANLTPITVPIAVHRIATPAVDNTMIAQIKTTIQGHFFSGTNNLGYQTFEGLVDGMTDAQKNMLIASYTSGSNGGYSGVTWFLYNNRNTLMMTQIQRNVVEGMKAKYDLDENWNSMRQRLQWSNQDYGYNPALEYWLGNFESSYRDLSWKVTDQLSHPGPYTDAHLIQLKNEIGDVFRRDLNKLDFLRAVMNDPRFLNNFHNLDENFFRRLEEMGRTHNWNTYQINADLLNSLAEHAGFWSRALQLSSMNRIMMGIVAAISLFVSILLSILLSRMKKVNNSKAIKKLIISLLVVFSIVTVGLAAFAGIGGA